MTFYLTSPRYFTRRWAVRPEEMTPVYSLPMDVRDDGEAYTLTAYVPGLKAEDLTIQVLDDTISVEGEYSQHEGEALVRELPSGSFRRSLRLPFALDAQKAEASIEHGVLTLRVPRAETARPHIIKIAGK